MEGRSHYFNVQGHPSFWWQSKARVRLPIIDHLRPYLAQFLRYSHLLANNRKFSLPHSHLAPLLGKTCFEFMKKLYGL